MGEEAKQFLLWRVEDHVEQALWLLTEKGQARGPRRADWREKQVYWPDLTPVRRSDLVIDRTQEYPIPRTTSI